MQRKADAVSYQNVVVLMIFASLPAQGTHISMPGTEMGEKASSCLSSRSGLWLGRCLGAKISN